MSALQIVCAELHGALAAYDAVKRHTTDLPHEVRSSLLNSAHDRVRVLFGCESELRFATDEDAVLAHWATQPGVRSDLARICALNR